MLILFDHVTPSGIARFLPGHTVTKAKDRGWDTLANGDLLAEAERAGFDVLLTADKNMRYQQNLRGRKIAIVVLSTPQWPVVRSRRPTQPHICVKKRSNGMYTVLRQTIRKRLQAKLNAVKAELQRRMHEPIPEQGKWLQAVVRGHLRYYGVPMNNPALALFRFQVGRLWHRALSRRSQNGRVLWDRMRRLIARWLPLPTVCHPYPLRRMGVIT